MVWEGNPMKTRQDMEVAVLLATYNGARFAEQQIRSLKDNATPFTLYWLDDHSTDNTREVVRATALRSRIRVIDCHQREHQGVPTAFFQLLESVDADIYLFCDQDDIWQPGKIDSIVENLFPDIALPVLCCTDPFMFRTDEPGILYRLSEVTRAKAELALQESRLFMAGVANGHTQGFTRPLRDIFLAHKDVARAYAYMHDEWMHNIAVAAGAVRVLHNAPTTLYRWHGRNASGAFCSWNGEGVGHVSVTLHQHQYLRRLLSRQAKGFILASPTLPSSPKLDRLMLIARLVATLDCRQSPRAVLRLMCRGILWPSRRLAFGLAATCLWSDAR
jgi:rhamnosyltransferase